MKIEKMTKISKDESEKLFRLYCEYLDTMDQKEEKDVNGTERDLAQCFITRFLKWMEGIARNERVG